MNRAKLSFAVAALALSISSSLFARSKAPKEKSAGRRQAQQASASTGVPSSAQRSDKSPPPAQEPVSAAVPAEGPARRTRVELLTFDNAVSNGFGHWWGGGLSVAYTPSRRVTTVASLLSQSRPGETEQLIGLRTLVNWSKWFYTDVEVNGGGPDNPAAFFPRFRYDLTGNLKLPWLPGVIFTGGLTRLYFGMPNSGRIARVGAIYYWKRFVLQGNLNFNNARPGNHKSKSASGALQYGQEGRYWIGFTAGGGREAWQTLALTPQDVQFTSYSASIFFRKWLAPSYGLAFSYSYVLKRTAYQINGVQMRFFVDF